MAAPSRRSQDDAHGVDSFEEVEVPATVVCAHCGGAECPGCGHDVSRSGIVAVVAWERPGLGLSSRLWMTARATTLDAEHFFESLPDGSVMSALRFAFTSELVGLTAMLVPIVAGLVVLVPEWARHVIFDKGDIALRVAFVGIPAIATMLVAAHTVYALALNRGARKAGGAKPSLSRVLRFGLYGAGWDLVLGPLGFALVLSRGGLRAVGELMTASVGLPTRSSRAFLRGAHRLQGPPAQRALRLAGWAALIATLISAVVVLAALFALILI